MRFRNELLLLIMILLRALQSNFKAVALPTNKQGTELASQALELTLEQTSKAKRLSALALKPSS